MNILSQYPSWFYLGCLILGLLFAFALYRKDKRLNAFSRFWLLGLTFLRFLSVSTIAFLLLNPLIEYRTKRIQAPILVFAIDDSQSMILGNDSTILRSKFQLDLESIQDELAEEYQVEQFLFSDEVRKSKEPPSFSGTTTSFNPLWDEIRARYGNRNLGAVILVSDGLYNRGEDPNYLPSLQVPIYSVPTGDTNQLMDARINRINSNEIAFLGNDFPVEVELFFKACAGQRSRLEIRKGDELVFEQDLNIETNSDWIEIKTSIEAKEIGLSRYTATILPLPGEEQNQNNSMDFFVDVLDGRQRILILTQGPHPDIRALKSTLQSKENLQVETMSIDQWNGSAADFDLAIFYQLPFRGDNQTFTHYEAFKKKGISSLMIYGPASDFPRLNSFQTGLLTTTGSSEGDQARAKVNDQFPLFQLSEESIRRIEAFTSLNVPMGEFKFDQAHYDLLNQTIGSVETDFPLLSFTQENEIKHGHLLGTNFWRWRLNEFASHESHSAFDELFLKTVQFLAIKSDKSYFRLTHEASFFENKSIIIQAQLYNESYELVNAPEVKMQLEDESGKQYSFAFNRNAEAYFLRIPGLAVGNYSYLASAELGGKPYQERGQFSVKKVQLEGIDLVANWNGLYQLSEKSGGSLIQMGDMASFKDLLKNQERVVSISYDEKELEDLIDMKWIFYVLLISLSLEWFIRKRQGAY